MKVLQNYTQASEEFYNGCSLVIGDFDGVHLGHQLLLENAKNKANLLNIPMVVMLFEPQPKEFFQKHNTPIRITSLEDKLHILEEFGIDIVVVQQFNENFANISAAEFIENILVKTFKLKYLTIGYDFKFGSNREGDVKLLQQFGEQYSFVVDQQQAFTKDGIIISSTLIREILQDGNLEYAQKLLDRKYSLKANIFDDASSNYPLEFKTNSRGLPVKYGKYSVSVYIKEDMFLAECYINETAYLIFLNAIPEFKKIVSVDIVFHSYL